MKQQEKKKTIRRSHIFAATAGTLYLAGFAFVLLGGSWLLLLATTLAGWIFLVIKMLIADGRRTLPALDRTPLTATIIGHRLVGDTNRRLTSVSYTDTAGRNHRADLADEIAVCDIDSFTNGTGVQVYALADPELAESVVFLTEHHDAVIRDGYWVNGVRLGQTGGSFSPTAGSPFLRSSSPWRFADPSAPGKASVTPETPRPRAVIRWIVLCAVGVIIAAAVLGAILQAPPNGSDPLASIWACILLVGLALIPAAAALIRYGIGGSTPLRTHRHNRALIAWFVVPSLIVGCVLGIGRLIWYLGTDTQPSAAIGIGQVAYFNGTSESHEVVVVPYKLDPMVGGLSARVAAFDLDDGRLLWDKRLDSDPGAGYPVGVTAFDNIGGDDREVKVKTERGAFGFDLEYGDLDCRETADVARACAEDGQGTLADIGEPRGEGVDLYGVTPLGITLTGSGGIVLDPATGAAAGAGFNLTYAVGEGVRLIVAGEVIAEITNVSYLQQVLTAPSGRVVLLAEDRAGKGVVVMASATTLTATVIGDRGYIPWPGPFGSGW